MADVGANAVKIISSLLISQQKFYFDKPCFKSFINCYYLDSFRRISTKLTTFEVSRNFDFLYFSFNFFYYLRITIINIEKKTI